MTDATKEEPPLDPQAAKDGPKGKGMAAHMVHHRAPNTNHSDPEHPLSCIRSERLARQSPSKPNADQVYIAGYCLISQFS